MLNGGGVFRAAEKLEVQFEGMSIPISIRELWEWSNSKSYLGSELASWLNLLDPQSRDDLVRLLNAPLLKDRSMARQMLRSWVGRQLLDEVSDLIRLDEDRSGLKVLTTLEILLDRQPQVTTLDLLKALPAGSIHLDLDALLGLAGRWRYELEKQQQLVLALSSRKSKIENLSNTGLVGNKFSEPSSFRKKFKVSHRREPLVLEIWQPAANTSKRSSWVVIMPGLGGSQDHFRWLARRLSRGGWPVVVLEHPGSDVKALQALLEGSRPAPGAEVLPDRMADLHSVVKAKENDNLVISGKKLILIGHSLGSLTAFLASGAYPEEDLVSRCQKALDGLSLTNLSQLLQCQLVDVPLKKQQKILELESIIAINSFGSLLWPGRGEPSITVPVFLAGGTLDLITPPLSEQLGLFLSINNHPFSRVLLVEGASHFSPVRVEGQEAQKSGDDLFQLGEAFVGVQPLAVQDLLSKEIIRFLDQLEKGKALETSLHKKENGLRLHILARSTIDKLLNN